VGTRVDPIKVNIGAVQARGIEPGEFVLGALILNPNGDLSLCFDSAYVDYLSIEDIDKLAGKVREFLLRAKGIMQ
jgi:hypothetical protein